MDPMDKARFRRYSAYGLKVRSSIPLTEFSPLRSGVADVLVTYGHEAEWTSTVRHQSEAIDITGDEARFWFRGVGAFIVRNRTDIVAIPEPGVPASLLRLYIQGMMMGMILHQRGMCVLHSSVIDHQGSAVALLGHVGAGKSSLAAALYGRGYRVVADDNAAITFSNQALTVWPSFPYVKLFSQIAEMLGFPKNQLRDLDSSQVKKAGRVTNGFTDQPIPLSRIYVLGREFGPEVTRLSRLQATVELIRNSIPTRWGHRGDAGQLQRCAFVATQVPVFTLRTFTELGAVGTVADSLEAHLRQNASAGSRDTETAGPAPGSNIWTPIDDRYRGLVSASTKRAESLIRFRPPARAVEGRDDVR